MIPVLTPAEMTEVDRNSVVGTSVLVDRAATKVAAVATEMMGGTYGRRVVVIAGPGNNGEDGRIAARKLSGRGVRVSVLDATALSSDLSLESVDLVIDAAFGTGFRGAFAFPRTGDVPVLSVDIPSGVSGLTGVASGKPPQADETVTFAALKPGLLFGAGLRRSGSVRLVDIGLDVGEPRIHLIEDSDVGDWMPERGTGDHKWTSALWLFAGSPGMTGAATLSSAAAMRAGAGYVRLTGVDGGTAVAEVVSEPLEPANWATALDAESQRFGAVAVGPGLGRSSAVREAVVELCSLDGFALLVDGDGLNALGRDAPSLLSSRAAPTVLTPHDREFERLSGSQPGEDRIAAARELSVATSAVVLLKGPTTVVADPGGQVLLSNSGDARLATAGSGDVLTGIIGAHLAMGMDPLFAAASAAFIHGRAAASLPAYGVVASDLVDVLGSTRYEIVTPAS